MLGIGGPADVFAWVEQLLQNSFGIIPAKCLLAEINLDGIVSWYDGVGEIFGPWSECPNELFRRRPAPMQTGLYGYQCPVHAILRWSCACSQKNRCAWFWSIGYSSNYDRLLVGNWIANGRQSRNEKLIITVISVYARFSVLDIAGMYKKMCLSRSIQYISWFSFSRWMTLVRLL